MVNIKSISESNFSKGSDLPALPSKIWLAKQAAPVRRNPNYTRTRVGTGCKLGNSQPTPLFFWAIIFFLKLKNSRKYCAQANLNLKSENTRDYLRINTMSSWVKILNIPLPPVASTSSSLKISKILTQISSNKSKYAEQATESLRDWNTPQSTLSIGILKSYFY